MGDIRRMFDPKTVAIFGDMEADGTDEKTLFANLRPFRQAENVLGRPWKEGRRRGKKGGKGRRAPSGAGQQEGAVQGPATRISRASEKRWISRWW